MFQSSENVDKACALARQIADIPETEIPDAIYRMGLERRLCRTVRALNALSQTSLYKDLGRDALRRLGLESCG
jgi:hypothetical protein